MKNLLFGLSSFYMYLSKKLQFKILDLNVSIHQLLSLEEQHE